MFRKVRDFVERVTVSAMCSYPCCRTIPIVWHTNLLGTRKINIVESSISRTNGGSLSLLSELFQYGIQKNRI